MLYVLREKPDAVAALLTCFALLSCFYCTYLLYLASAGALELRDVYSAKNLMQFLEFSKELGWQVC